MIICNRKYTLYTIGFDGNDFREIFKFPNMKLKPYIRNGDYIFDSYFFAHKFDANFTDIIKYDLSIKYQKKYCISQILNQKLKMNWLNFE